MNDYDIIQQLEVYALAQDWIFVYVDASDSSDFEKNIRTKKHLTAGKTVLIVDMVARPQMREHGKLDSIQYDVLFMLGRKKDVAGTTARVSESHKQKYDRRLSAMYKDVYDFMSSFTCSETLTVSSPTITPRLNAFDTNIDFLVLTGLTFTKK